MTLPCQFLTTGIAALFLSTACTLQPGATGNNNEQLPDEAGAVQQMAASEFHTCAVHDSGVISCWGNNEEGELGDGTFADRGVPGLVLGIDNAVAVAAGRFHTCALHDDETVSCWGRGGSVGDGTPDRRNAPVVIEGLDGVQEISTGDVHSCALLADASVKCWGDNPDGRVGDGSMENRLSPVVVTGLTDAIMVRATEQHSCALRTGNTVVCWGHTKMESLVIARMKIGRCQWQWKDCPA